MIIDMKGSVLTLGNKNFEVGGSVVANSKSVYKSLVGKILEIRTGEDVLTRGNEVDVYVCFDEAQSDEIISKIEKRFMPDNRCMEYDERINYDCVALSPNKLETFRDLFNF